VRVLLAVVAVLVAAASCSPQPPAEPSGEEARVREAFRQYKDALLQQDGEVAVTLVSAATLAYYEDMRRLAVTAGRPEIEAQSLTNRLFITMLRHEIGATELAGMSEKEVFVFAVDEGLVGAEGTIEAIDIGEITVSDDTATGEAVSQGQPSGISWEFRREDGAWKIHFVELLQLANIALEQAARESGLDDTEFIFTLVETVSGRAVPTDIWEKPKRAA
jgi:hypothetical protein